MASFNSLPLELLFKIVDLAAEDYVALEDELARRKILLSLALVSTIFTSPAQQALWRYIDLRRSNYTLFIRVIREGIGRDKKVKKLIFELEGERAKKDLNLKWFLEVLGSIDAIEELNLSYDCGHVAYWSYLFEIASVKNIKCLELDTIVVLSDVGTFPATLRSLTFADIESAESFLSQLSLNPSVAVDTMKFDFIQDLDILIDQFEGSISYFKLHGVNLRNLSFEFFDPSMILILLPHTLSLLHLALLTERNSMQTTLKHIQALPSSTRLISLDIGEFKINAWREVNFLLPLLVLPQLSHLELLSSQIYNHRYAEYYEEGRLGELPDGLTVKPALDRAVKLCRDRGVRLSFRSERTEHYVTEIRKQEVYRVRQKELDRR